MSFHEQKYNEIICNIYFKGINDVQLQITYKNKNIKKNKNKYLKHNLC